MKKLMMTMTLLLLASQSFAATIHGARLDDKRENLLIDVSYPGGCKDHSFRLKIGMCLESNPPSCTAELIDETKGDICEAIVPMTVSFSLKDDNLLGLRALTITGDLDWRTKKPSQATVDFP